jgi:hypothetical protein
MGESTKRKHTLERTKLDRDQEILQDLGGVTILAPHVPLGTVPIRQQNPSLQIPSEAISGKAFWKAKTF